jgi:hypothetical protein
MKKIVAPLLLVVLCSCNNSNSLRQGFSLNGEWQIAETRDTIPPVLFMGRIPVPGLMDLAQPPFDSLGIRSTCRNYFWYRRTVSLNIKPSGFAYLKIHKAKFGQALFVNGNFVGKNEFCFTPAYFEVSRFLNFSGENEILIRIGADPSVLPDTIPFGYDVEKSIYYPGIYDNVALYTGDYPYISNVQIAPVIDKSRIRVAVELQNGSEQKNCDLLCVVKERVSENVVAAMTIPVSLIPDEEKTAMAEISIPSARLWSPDEPFLYTLEVSTAGDSRTDIFGMRQFCFDAPSRVAMLNGKPLFMRGTNMAIHRFFEDTVRHALPWDRNWIEKMHDEFKDMHWNAYRFHVGFAPDIWYDVADEKGFLVQDEYAVWGIWSDSEKKRHHANVLAQEYERWMRERWNHPGVVIWDAQNETKTDQTGIAIRRVRDLDLSHRPCDNGYSPPQSAVDAIESHPYLFVDSKMNTFAIQPPWRFDSTKAREPLPAGGWLKDEFSVSPETSNDASEYFPPGKDKRYPNPVVVNEYGWIWLYRDGSPTWAAEEVWKYYPERDTPEKRWDWRGRVLAAETEYWRSTRKNAGVLYFCALTCNRPWGKVRSQVSDDWLDVPNLVMQPLFKKYVKPAFSPVGIMIEKWDDVFKAGENINVPVILINDLYSDWSGNVTLNLMREETVVSSQSIHASVKRLGKERMVFALTIPDEEGTYEMTAELIVGTDRVFSSRLFEVR